MPENQLTPSAAQTEQIVRLIDGFLVTQLLYVAVQLGVADVLAAGPCDAETVADAVGVEPDPLRRVLRGLVSEGVFDETNDGRFGLTELGACLRRDVPWSQCGAIRARGEVYYGGAAALLEAIRYGGVAFERVHGLPLFEYLARHADLGAAFQASMADRSSHEAADVVAAYEFSSFENIVDVGGGNGLLLEAILRTAVNSRGMLLDQPQVVEQARQRLEATKLAERCTFVSGDFFTSVPTGGDAYVLSRIIHDWDDNEAICILEKCHAAMDDHGRLLLVEALLPERAREQPAAIRMDLFMMTFLHGRERTKAEYERLLSAAGFRLMRVVPTRSPVGLSVIEASPIPLASRS